MPKKPKTTSKPDQVLADATRISPQQIWQAGLGAFIKAQEEGDRAFGRLVSEGSELTRRERAEHAPDDPQAPTSWHRLEQMFEDRVARALAAMDVPTHRDLDELKARIDELTGMVAALGGAAPLAGKAARKAAPKRAAAKPAVKQAAATKPAVAKKAAAKTAVAKKAVAKKAVAKKAAAKQGGTRRAG